MSYIIGIARPFPTHQARGLFSLPDNTCQSPHSWHTGHLRLRKVVLGMGHLRHFRDVSAEGGAQNGTPTALSRTALTPFTATTQTKPALPLFS